MRSLLDSGLRIAITVVIAVLLLRWAWTMFKPLLPITLVLVAGVIMIRLYVVYRRHW